MLMGIVHTLYIIVTIIDEMIICVVNNLLQSLI